MDALQEGLAAVKAGQRDRARALLGDYLQQHPNSETAWLWLSVVVDTPHKAIDCLERALAINPHSQRAQAGLKWARSRVQTVVAPPPAPPQPVADTPPRPAPVEAPAPTGAPGLLKHLGAAPPIRAASPYAPTRLFTEQDMVSLSPLTPGPDEPAEPEPALAEPATWGWTAPEPDDREPLGPAPSLAERLGAWRSPGTAAAPAPSWSPPPLPEATTDLGPAPSLAERLGGWGTPAPETEPLEDWAAPPSLAERLSGFGARSAPAPAEPVLAGPARREPTPPAQPSPLDRLRGLHRPPAQPAGLSVEELVAQGVTALESNQPGEAEQLFRQALSQAPDHPEAHANLAMVYYAHGRRAEAISELKITVQHQPDYEDALYTLATLLGESGRPDEARDAWRQLLRVNPRHTQAQQELDRLTSPGGKRPAGEEAIRCPNCNGLIHTTVSTCPHCNYELFVVCPRCKEYVPVGSPTCPGCGYAFQETGAATGDGQSARQNADVHTRLGLAHLEDGRGMEALREWQEAIRIDPTYAAPYFYTGLLYVEQRQLARAAESFLEAVRRDADYAEAYLELGVIYLAQNKRAMAQRALEECLKHRPSSEVRSEVEARLAGLR